MDVLVENDEKVFKMKLEDITAGTISFSLTAVTFGHPGKLTILKNLLTIFVSDRQSSLNYQLLHLPLHNFTHLLIKDLIAQVCVTLMMAPTSAPMQEANVHSENENKSTALHLYTHKDTSYECVQALIEGNPTLSMKVKLIEWCSWSTGSPSGQRRQDSTSLCR